MIKSKLDYLKEIKELLDNPNKKSLEMSKADCHHKGLFSLVISGTEPGKLTRVFIAHKKIKPYAVQIHTHRYPIQLTTIKGDVRHYIAYEAQHIDLESIDSTIMSKFTYRSPINEGSGLKYEKEVHALICDYSVPAGSTINMTVEEFHTVSCSKNSIWIVQEKGFETDESFVLGVPFITDGLYREPKMFEINDNHQMVMRHVNRMIHDYENVM